MAKGAMIGLDIGTSGVRAAEVTTGKRPFTLEGFGQVSLPAGAVVEGEIIDPPTVAAAISQLWRHARFKSKRVAIGLANQKVVVRPLDLPYMEEKELRGAIQFQVQEYIPIPVNDAVLDFVILDEYVTETNERMMRLLLVAAQKDMVNTFVNTVQQAGLDPAAVDVTPLALVRALSSGGDAFGSAGVGEAIIDVGAGITNIVVHEGGVTRFVRILLTGSNSLSDSLAAGLGVSFEDAEGIKQRLGMAPDPQQGAAATEAAARILEQRATAFVEEVRGTLDYYQAQSGSIRIQRVVVTGGGSKLANLEARLGLALRVPVERGRALSKMKVGKVGLSEAQLADAEPLMSASLGLAMGDAE